MSKLDRPRYLLFKRHDEYNIVTVENFLAAFDDLVTALWSNVPEAEIIVEFDGERLRRSYVLGPEGWAPACRSLCGGNNNTALVALPALMGEPGKPQYSFHCTLCNATAIGSGEMTPDEVFFSGQDVDFTDGDDE